MRVVILLLLLPFFSLQFPREELFNIYDNTTRPVITYKTECWGDNNAMTYLANVKIVCAVLFHRNVAGGWDRQVLGGVVVPKDSIQDQYFPCQCSNNTIVICCPGGYCDKNIGVMKTVICGLDHQFYRVKANNLMADIIREQFEDKLYVEEIHGGWDDLTFLHGSDQYGNNYLEYPLERINLAPIYQQYAI